MIDGRIYIPGGFSGIAGAADLEMYDPDVAGSIDNQGRVLILD